MTLDAPLTLIPYESGRLLRPRVAIFLYNEVGVVMLSVPGYFDVPDYIDVP